MTQNLQRVFFYQSTEWLDLAPGPDPEYLKPELQIGGFKIRSLIGWCRNLKGRVWTQNTE
jgi:hypothetical protein